MPSLNRILSENPAGGVVRLGFIAAAALMLTAVAPTPADAADRVFGIIMPPEATRIGEDRYRTTKNLSRTRRYFARTVGTSRGLVWRPIRGNPNVSGVHIINNRAGREWDGLNIYEYRGKVYIYVVKSPVVMDKKKR